MVDSSQLCGLQPGNRFQWPDVLLEVRAITAQTCADLCMTTFYPHDFGTCIALVPKNHRHDQLPLLLLLLALPSYNSHQACII